MRILIDTHIFLWFALNDPQLSKKWIGLIKDYRNDVYLSIASLWEISIKSGLGKLDINAPFMEFVNNNVYEEGIQLLDVNVSHLAEVQVLPYHHGDPFDRLMIAQSIVEDLEFMTVDTKFDPYDFKRVR